MRPRRQALYLHQELHLHQLVDYSGTRLLDGTRSLFLKRIPSSIRRQLVEYSGTRHLDWTSSLYPKRILMSIRRQLSTTSVLDLRMGQAPYISEIFVHLVDYYGTRPLEDKPPIYKIYTSTRRQLIDYYSTRPEKRQHLKKRYSSTRWKLRKRHDLYIHTRRSTKKSPNKRNLIIH